MHVFAKNVSAADIARFFALMASLEFRVIPRTHNAIAVFIAFTLVLLWTRVNQAQVERSVSEQTRSLDFRRESTHPTSRRLICMRA